MWLEARLITGSIIFSTWVRFVVSLSPKLVKKLTWKLFRSLLLVLLKCKLYLCFRFTFNTWEQNSQTGHESCSWHWRTRSLEDSLSVSMAGASISDHLSKVSFSANELNLSEGVNLQYHVSHRDSLEITAELSWKEY